MPLARFAKMVLLSN